MNDELVDLRIDTSTLMSGIERMIPQSKQELSVMLRDEVARPLLRKIIGITPPGKGSLNHAAKKAGEALIASDIGRIMRPASQSYIDLCRRAWGGSDIHVEQFGHAGASPIGAIYTQIISGSTLRSWHHDRRSKTTGRVGFMGKGKVANWNHLEKSGGLRTNQERAKGLTTGVRRMDLRNLDLALTPRAEFNAYVRKEQSHVGMLAAGWNPAAAKLDVSIPAWVKRHGTDAGQCVMNLTGDDMRIFISNDVPYGERVENFRARVQTAVDWQARDIHRRVDAFARKDRKL